jgi:hypothetical protein
MSILGDYGSSREFDANHSKTVAVEGTPYELSLLLIVIYL